jgi:outer membrane lipoprotein-sorting protein
MRTLVVGLAAVIAPIQVSAQGISDIQFSATAVQSMPNDQTMTAKLYNGPDMVRQEMTQEDQTRITISDARKGVAWMLNPERKEYVEFKAPAPGASGAGSPPARMPLPDEPTHPCQQKDAALKCTRLGSETLEGRQTDQWEFVATQGEESYRTVMWIDQRLRIPVRMEGPGGAASELRDIREGPQPPELFSIPADYKRIEMPQRAPQNPMGPAPE